MNKMMQEEFDGLIADKRNSEEILNNELVKFADEIKNGLGDEIKQELLNPTNHTVKKSKKKKERRCGEISNSNSTNISFQKIMILIS